MLVDANLLLFAVHRASPFHSAAKDWLQTKLNGSSRVGLPWQTLGAFLRVATEPRVFDRPLSPQGAWDRVAAWLSAEAAWVPQPGVRYGEILRHLILQHDVRGSLVTDAQLAALALEHGLTVCSADTDFARFSDLRWENPLVA
jgi:toxin-antitoxin system PIN domain toxin